jgi:hypothetical protein
VYPLGILIVSGIAAPMIALQIYALYRDRSGSRRTRVARWLGTALGSVGLASFFGIALSAVGGLDWLPQSVEWPVGYARGVITLTDGTHVVPLVPANRVQIYDPEWRFLRGWRVDAGAGVFKLLPVGTDHFEVVTARGNLRLEFKPTGELVSQRSYQPQLYDSFGEAGVSRFVATPVWLWPFTHPFIGWGIAVAGGVTVSITEGRRRRRRRRARA